MRDLPRAIGISCVLCLAIYVLTVIAFHTTLSTNEVLGSEAVAVTFANRLYGKVGPTMDILQRSSLCLPFLYFFGYSLFHYTLLLNIYFTLKSFFNISAIHSLICF